MSDTESDEDIRFTVHPSNSRELDNNNTIIWSVGEFPPPGVQVTSRLMTRRPTFPLLSTFIATDLLNTIYADVDVLESQLFESAIEHGTNDRKPEQKIDVNYFRYNPKKHDIGEDNSCSICHNDYSRGEYLSILNCDHIFHTKCIEEWGLYKPECPLCRCNIPLQEQESVET